MTTTAHGQKFNYLDDDCIEALKPFIMLPHLRWLNLGRTVLSADGFQEVKSAATNFELIYFNMHRVQITNSKDAENGIHDDAPAPKSRSLEIRRQMAKNQAKYYPHIENYDKFLDSEDLRFLRNTFDVRKIDSMYQTRDKRLGLPMDAKWEKNDPTWKLIAEDVERWEKLSEGIAV
jgi:hypothetical protein